MKLTSYLALVLPCTSKTVFSSIEKQFLNDASQYNDHVIIHRMMQQDPYWESFGKCLNGSVVGVELGNSISLSSDGNFLVTESDIGVFLNEYDSQIGWTQRFDFSDFLIDPGMNGKYEVVISSDGSRIAVGAPFNEENGSRSGAVQVFEKQNNTQTWSQIGSTLYGDEASDTYGYSLDLSENGDKIIIGAFVGNYVEILKYEEETSSWVREKLYQGNLDGYGYSVAISGAGDRVVVGAPFEKNSVGAVRFYDIETDSFVETINGASVGDEYGKTVDMSQDGTIAAIGAPGNDQVLLFQHDIDSNEWQQVGRTINGTNGEGFGSSLSLSEDGSAVVIGAPFFGSGNAYVYKYDDDWVQVGEGIFGENSGDSCGTSVALSSNNVNINIVVGCPEEDSEGPNAGQVCAYYLFFPSSSPSQQPSAWSSLYPSESPSVSTIPSLYPTQIPSLSVFPSSFPSHLPSISPTLLSSQPPSKSSFPSLYPSQYPSQYPSLGFTEMPTTDTLFADPDRDPVKETIVQIFSLAFVFFLTFCAGLLLG